MRQDAEAWARRVECEIDNGKTPTAKKVVGIKTFGGLIDLHLADMKAVGKQIGRSKAFGQIDHAHWQLPASVKYPVEHTQGAPAHKSIVDHLLRALRSGRISPTQTVEDQIRA